MSDINIPNKEQWEKMNDFLNTIAVSLTVDKGSPVPKKVEPGEEVTAGFYAGATMFTINDESTLLAIPPFYIDTSSQGQMIVPLGFDYSLVIICINTGITWVLMDGREVANLDIDLFLCKLM